MQWMPSSQATEKDNLCGGGDGSGRHNYKSSEDSREPRVLR